MRISAPGWAMPVTGSSVQNNSLEREREEILAVRKREKSRPILPEKLVFSDLNFEEKKLVAAQFVERINIAENSAEVKWSV